MVAMQTVTRLAFTLFASFAVLMAGTSVAAADEPVTWDSGEGLSSFDVLLLFVGAPIAIFVGITVLAALLHRKNNYVPPPPSTDVEPVDHH